MKGKTHEDLDSSFCQKDIKYTNDSISIEIGGNCYEITFKTTEIDAPFSRELIEGFTYFLKIISAVAKK